MAHSMPDTTMENNLGLNNHVDIDDTLKMNFNDTIVQDGLTKVDTDALVNTDSEDINVDEGLVVVSSNELI